MHHFLDFVVQGKISMKRNWMKPKTSWLQNLRKWFHRTIQCCQEQTPYYNRDKFQSSIDKEHKEEDKLPL